MYAIRSYYALSQYASEKLWQPLGAHAQALWSLDKKDGTEKAYCCFNSNARDFALLGELILHKGWWRGKQLIPEAYIAESTSISSLHLKDAKTGEVVITSYSIHYTKLYD